MQWIGGGFQPFGLVLLLALTAYLGYRRGLAGEVIGLVGLVIALALTRESIMAMIRLNSDRVAKAALFVLRGGLAADNPGDAYGEIVKGYRPLITDSNQEAIQLALVLVTILLFYGILASRLGGKAAPGGALLGAVNGYLLSLILLPTLPDQVPPPSRELVTTSRDLFSPLLDLISGNVVYLVLAIVAFILLFAARAILTGRS